MLRKKIVLSILALGVGYVTLAQDKINLAEVEVINGKEVYLLNNPVRDFEVVGEVRTGLKFNSILTRGIINEDITDKAAQFTRRTIRKLSKKEKEFDAILYASGKKVQAIKFTEAATAKNERLAEVEEFFGLYTFIMAEPLNSYSVEEDVKFILKPIPFLTYGWINNSIERDVKLYAKKANRKYDDAKYIAYQTGRRASVISFD